MIDIPVYMTGDVFDFSCHDKMDGTAAFDEGGCLLVS